jgi:tripeptidyl-peptidase I
MQDRLRVAVTIVAVAIAALQTVSCHPFKSSQQGLVPNQFAQILDAGIDGSKRNLHSFKETSKILSTHDAITRRHRAPSTQLHDVVIVLEQKNMKELTRILHDVSDPTSPNYGKHMTREEVRDLTSNMESHDEIVSYLRGVGAKVIEEKYKGETITARAPIEVWERMFDTEFFVYAYENLPGIESTTSAKTETIIIRTEEYSVPKGFDGHVAAVLNTVEIPVSMHLTSRPTRREPLVSVGPNKFAVASKKFDGYTSPQLLTEVYKIDDSTGHPRATQGVFEAFNQYYSPEDIEIFQLQFELPNYPVNRSTADRAQTSDFCATNDFEVCIGPNLDLQYIMAMAQTPTINYYTPLTTFGLWAQALFNTDKHPPLVISISYGTEERVTSRSEFDLFNTFAQKLGVIGVTLVAGSGDDGVSRPSVRIQKRDCGYSPQFPASCPYVTAVGATQVTHGALLIWTCKTLH